METFTILDLLDLDLKEHNDLQLKCIGGRPGLINQISVPNFNRPGLELSGFFEKFANDRIQIFGSGENAYLEKLSSENNYESVKQLFSYEIPCCIFTYDMQPSDKFLEIAEEAKCPILQTPLPSTTLATRLLRALENAFAQKKLIHGVLVEVFGIGCLIMGDSGVGKSESALELIERGHRLIADDSVELQCVSGNIIMGAGPNPSVAHHMEIRGLGIININQLFGVGAIRNRKQVQLIIELEEWESEKTYDRVGTEQNTRELLGVSVPCATIPVKPGRNIPIIIETAAMNERLKKMGYHSAREFNQNVLRWLESENARNLYSQKRDIF